MQDKSSGCSLGSISNCTKDFRHYAHYVKFTDNDYGLWHMSQLYAINIMMPMLFAADIYSYAYFEMFVTVRERKR